MGQLDKRLSRSLSQSYPCRKSNQSHTPTKPTKSRNAAREPDASLPIKQGGPLSNIRNTKQYIKFDEELVYLHSYEHIIQLRVALFKHTFHAKIETEVPSAIAVNITILGFVVYRSRYRKVQWRLHDKTACVESVYVVQVPASFISIVCSVHDVPILYH